MAGREIYDLNDMIDPESGWELEEAYDINDNDMILCLGTLNGGDEQYILLKPVPDTDGDGIADDADNCPATANADQTDTDGDGYDNMCDCDINGDGTVNMADYAIFRSRWLQSAPFE